MARNLSNGYTLIEMLAALLVATVVLAAATGFMVIALTRQSAIVQAERTEAYYDALAESIKQSVKSCRAFQIYGEPNQEQFQADNTPINGAATGNELVCVRSDGSIDRFTFNSRQQTLKYQTSAEPNPGFNAAVSLSNSYPTCFNDQNGVVEAHWTVQTLVDVVYYDLYAVPLQWR
jgi:prepilin-type N-terminal cleavage/methylation domain-containing protein